MPTLADVMEDLDEEGIPFRRDMPIGMMVETPSAAMLSSASRQGSGVPEHRDERPDPVHAGRRPRERARRTPVRRRTAQPSFKLIRQVVLAAQRADIDVSLCGEMAGAPLYCQILIGLGLRQLSMAPGDIVAVKRVVRSTTRAKCERIAKAVMRFDSDRQVLNYLRDQHRETVEDDEP